MLVDAPSSPEAEAFRTLRTSISLLGEESEFRGFLFTSALPSEGKTFVALNFALSLAQQGLETVIIDADLREPRVERALRSQGESVGVTDLLSGQIDLNDAVKAAPHDNLILLPAGRRAPDPAKLLGNKQFEKIVESLLREFDRVVIDSPPVNAVSDALLVAASAHATCLVVRAGKTPKEQSAAPSISSRRSCQPRRLCFQPAPHSRSKRRLLLLLLRRTGRRGRESLVVRTAVRPVRSLKADEHPVLPEPRSGGNIMEEISPEATPMTKGGNRLQAVSSGSSLREQDSQTHTPKGRAPDEHSLSIDLLLPV